MGRFHVTVLALVVVLLGATPVWAAPQKSAPALTEAERDAQKLAARIDELISARWKANGIKPAAPADDAEFLRRVYLDLVGRIPSITEVRDFLDNPDPDKRRKLVERLFVFAPDVKNAERKLYVEHFTNIWRALLLPQYNSPELRGTSLGFEAWLRKRIAENVGYDQMVREILTVSPLFRGDASPSIFYQANELRPENVAGAASRLFLGVKLECAQCHDHPAGHWTRKQFWQFAAFFANVPQQGAGQPGANIKELPIPGTDKIVQAVFLDGKEPEWKNGVDPREILANWIVSPDNPYFARNAVNRLWEYFFGTGLIEPVDEPSADNPPSHPELLDELAKQFAAHKFDLKFLIRAITSSKTYQLTSALSHPTQDEPRMFARMAIRGLTAEQLFDSLAEATDYKDRYNNAYYDARGYNTPRAEFVARFPNQDKRTETQTSILQALYLMNGKITADATSLERNPNLRTIADASSSTTARRIQELYMITLSRKPRPEETERLVKYVDSGGPTGDPKKALTDVFWALLNCTEFYFNH